MKRWWYAPETDSTYSRDGPGAPDHIEIAGRPSPYHRYDRASDSWIAPDQATLDRLAAEQEKQAAEQKVRDRYAVSMRLVLWLMRYVWPRLTTEEKAEIRSIIPDEMEQEVRTALSKLP